MSKLSLILNAAKDALLGGFKSAIPSLHEAIDGAIKAAIDGAVDSVEAALPSPELMADEILAEPAIAGLVNGFSSKLKAVLPADVQALPEVAAILATTPAEAKTLVVAALDESERKVKQYIEAAAKKVEDKL